MEDSAGNIITLYYNSLGQATTESHDAGPLAGLALTRNYDSLGRPSGLSLNPQPSTLNHSYAYDAAGRLAVVSDGTVSAGYSYLANSPLVEYTYFTNGSTHVMTTSRTYDYLNRLRKIEALNAQQSTVLNSYAYAYNAANQRTAVTNVDSSRWAFGYDPLGQVTSGKRYWSDNQPVAGQQFEYEFDDIGNRKLARSGGDNAGANLRQATYTANYLNQYASRTVPGSADIVGTATNAATVSANLTASARHGDYYRVNVAANNTTGAVWQAVAVVGVLQGTSTNNPDLLTTNTGNLFFSRTPEAFAYDADGNLTSDGRFSYTWDAENRLVQVESHATNAAGSKVKVTWAYDPLGRRIRQTEYDGSTGSYAVVQDLKLAYDGWQCLAELNATNDLVIRSYLWGLDLSGTRTGAGGVGGLLAINSTAQGRHFCSYDGNGNVAALIKATDGSLSANYEYGPFGETIRATGAMADENAFQFSTKRMVRGIGVVLYEFRVYTPTLGRWLSRDPIEERGGVNLFGTVKNDPQQNIDPLGLSLAAGLAYWSKPIELPPAAPPAFNAQSATLSLFAHFAYGGGTDLIQGHGSQWADFISNHKAITAAFKDIYKDKAKKGLKRCNGSLGLIAEHYHIASHTLTIDDVYAINVGHLAQDGIYIVDCCLNIVTFYPSYSTFWDEMVWKLEGWVPPEWNTYEGLDNIPAAIFSEISFIQESASQGWTTTCPAFPLGSLTVGILAGLAPSFQQFDLQVTWNAEPYVYVAELR